jgi:hypothetical protein
MHRHHSSNHYIRPRHLLSNICPLCRSRCLHIRMTVLFQPTSMSYDLIFHTSRSRIQSHQSMCHKIHDTLHTWTFLHLHHNTRSSLQDMHNTKRYSHRFFQMASSTVHNRCLSSILEYILDQSTDTLDPRYRWHRFARKYIHHFLR